MDRTAKAEADLILHKITRTNHWGTRVQTGEWVGIFWRFLWYTGAGLLVSSIAALAVRFWLPESMHMPLFLVVHSLCGGVVAVSLLRTLSRAKTGSTLHNACRTNQFPGVAIGSGWYTDPVAKSAPRRHRVWGSICLHYELLDRQDHGGQHRLLSHGADNQEDVQRLNV